MIDRNEIVELVRLCGREELLTRFQRVDSKMKADGSVVTEADLAAQARLQEALTRRYPEIAFAAEEMTPAERQEVMQGGGPFWILDPLDGTSNFAAGIPYFAISLCLIENGRRIWGTVYDPCRDECYTASAGENAEINGEPLKRITPAPTDIGECVAIVDFKRLPGTLACRLAEDPPFRSQRSFGSVALDWCWLAAGRGQLYLHGRQNIWDYAAGLLVFEQTGGSALTLEGERIFDSRFQARSAVAAISEDLLWQWHEVLALEI